MAVYMTDNLKYISLLYLKNKKACPSCPIRLTQLTLIESSCWRKASSASLLGENIRSWRELLGGRVVGTANPSLSPPEASRERGRFLPPAENTSILLPAGPWPFGADLDVAPAPELPAEPAAAVTHTDGPASAPEKQRGKERGEDSLLLLKFLGHARRSRLRQATMTSTNMFQGLDSSGKPSSRVLRPPGGGSSNLFGGYEEDTSASRRPNKMSSSIFAPPEETRGGPRRSNPPGGKSSGIFGDPCAASTHGRAVPPGGASSNIFGGAESTPPSVKSQHPNKPKDNLSVGVPATPDPPAPLPKKETAVKEVKAEPVTPQPTPEKEPPALAPAPAPAANQNSEAATWQPTEKDHEPRLGPRPRSHNKVLNPPVCHSSFLF
uniref:Jupiter microtubule associated homolog 2 n=3 Tax=Cyprinus carpio TaxID=7962 RepID=A0A8C2DU99_CYPCA